MFRYIITASFIFLLSGCTNTRHDTPEALYKIKQDLKLTTIIDSSRMNWCVHPYGSTPGCQPEKGVGIVTPNSLIMAHLVDGVYIAERSLKSEDIVCSTVPGGAAADGIFFAFTANEAYMLGPLKADRDEINTTFKAHMYHYLHSKGQPSFNGPEINFQRPSGRKTKQTTILSAGITTRVVTEEVDILEIYSPCQ